MSVAMTADSEAERILDWEMFMLLELGFSKEQAEKMLVSEEFESWHQAKDLLAKGASHAFVVAELT